MQMFIGRLEQWMPEPKGTGISVAKKAHLTAWYLAAGTEPFRYCVTITPICSFMYIQTI